MINRTTKLRWRRRFRRSKKHVEEFGRQTEEHMERHFFKHLSRFYSVRRFVFSWVLLLVLLSGGVLAQAQVLGRYYLKPQPTPGGIYTEGMLGNFTNANPIYASTTVDSSVSRLIFSGLLKYDQNNQLIGDLAEKIEVNDKGTLYTVTLKPNLKWHDGHSLTTEDVAFTYQTIQNPDAKSPFVASWQGVTIKVVNERTVTFNLPNALVSFPYSLTSGLVPKHILGEVPKTQLRSVGFNSVSPIGAGPFKWEGVNVSGETTEDRLQHISLAPFKDYAGGLPKLDKFILKIFRDESTMAEQFKKQEVNALSGLSSTPGSLRGNPEITEYNIPLTGAVMVFLKSSQDILKDPVVRKAISLATDPAKVVVSFEPPIKQVTQPFLEGQVGYDKNLSQQTGNLAQAQKILADAGWQPNAQGIRSKAGVPLTFRLFLQDNDEYGRIARTLQEQWKAAGIDAQLVAQSDSDLQTTLAFHNYDALVYGISIGADPDIFAYWHSTQADLRSPTRLNFSEYRSPIADRALEGGRTRAEPTLRTVKYKPFLEAWRNDVPAIGLYQPRFLYLVHGRVHGFDTKVMNSTSDRYSNVENWMMRQTQKAIDTN